VQIAFLGFGLIAGSVARAVRVRRPEWHIAAWSPSGDGPRAARADGVLDQAPKSPAAAMEGADLVVLGAPPLATLELLDRLGGPLHDALGSDTVVTDVASTKRLIVARAVALDLPFVGGHPMAGSDATGYGAADADLFAGRPWILCGGAANVVSRVETLVAAVGARRVLMDPAAHDAAVSAISHLPLVASVALVEAVAGGSSPDWPDARDLAAGGWRDMSRLARGDPEMGAGILATNADFVAARLRTLRAVIDEWLAMLEPEPDQGALRDRLERARDALDIPLAGGPG
jgi:prephenate dehydrogenase